MKKKNLWLMGLCIALVVSSFVIGTMKGGEFGGADDQIEDTVKQVDANYTPWFSHIWEPPSGEVESLLFAVQAAMGAGFIGYYIGKKKNVKANTSTVKNQ